MICPSSPGGGAIPADEAVEQGKHRVHRDQHMGFGPSEGGEAQAGEALLQPAQVPPTQRQVVLQIAGALPVVGMHRRQPLGLLAPIRHQVGADGGELPQMRLQFRINAGGEGTGQGSALGRGQACHRNSGRQGGGFDVRSFGAGGWRA